MKGKDFFQVVVIVLLVGFFFLLGVGVLHRSQVSYYWHEYAGMVSSIILVAMVIVAIWVIMYVAKRGMWGR